jgi:uncharacterized protein YndB with AHSA1/START domain
MNERDITLDNVVIERVFDAPPALIWQLWTEPQHFKNWYGPNGFTVPVAEMDLRVGGRRLVCMERQTPDGPMQMWTTGEYVEIVPTGRLVYTESMADENGRVLSPAEMGMPDGYPSETTVTVMLEDLNGRTRMTMTHAGVPGAEGANAGWQQAFDKMAALIK